MLQTSVSIAMVAISFVLCGHSELRANDWSRFRGPNGTGVSDAEVPTKFGKDTNIKWELKLPGRGVSSPIVIGDRVFVTCYSGYGVEGSEGAAVEDLERHLVCIDRSTGKIDWTATEKATMPEDEYSGMGVPAHGYASHTPTSDGERVYAFFGKSGVFAYDMDGNRLWHKEVGKESGRMQWGSASSPILHNDVLVVLASDESETMYGFDKKTGEELWRSEAAGFASVWGTPALAEGAKGTEIVVAVPDETWALNPENGKVRWYAQEMVADPIALSLPMTSRIPLVAAEVARRLWRSPWAARAKSKMSPGKQRPPADLPHRSSTVGTFMQSRAASSVATTPRRATKYSRNGCHRSLAASSRQRGKAPKKGVVAEKGVDAASAARVTLLL